MVEIERKFLVISDDFRNQATSKEHIVQGFLNIHPERTVRVRTTGDLGYLTVKGKSNVGGTVRFEWEKEIDKKDAQELLQLCEHMIIEKTRYGIPIGSHIFEVDEFYGENEGLIIAELELEDENESFDRPDWLGPEVSGELKYYNSQLSKKPYSKWKKQ
ncbi:MAG: CYTH domain-containing protein [Aurantibacter sp.]